MKHTRTRYQQGSLTTEHRQNGPDVYVFRWREKHSGGVIKRKRILGSTKELTKAQAQRKAASLCHSADNQPADVSQTSLTVAELVEHYAERELSESSGKVAKVRKAYRYIFNSYINPRWGALPLARVKTVQVEEWLKGLCKANGTKAKIREVFGTAFRHAMRHELFPSNPIANVRQVRKRAIEPSILEPFEIASILTELDGVEPVRTAFLVAALTGMRRGELFGLKWEDVDLGRANLHVRRSYVDGVEGPPKTDSSRRPLPLSAEAVDAIQEWKQQSSFTGPNDWVFASELSMGKQPLWPGTLWRRNVAPAILRVGIAKPKLGWHTLRRSYASLLLFTGASLRVSMELMRHSTPEMTLGTYAQSIGDDNRNAGAKVAALVMAGEKAA